jgi:hypothetical protein
LFGGGPVAAILKKKNVFLAPVSGFYNSTQTCFEAMGVYYSNQKSKSLTSEMYTGLYDRAYRLIGLQQAHTGIQWWFND